MPPSIRRCLFFPGATRGSLGSESSSVGSHFAFHAFALDHRSSDSSANTLCKSERTQGFDSNGKRHTIQLWRGTQFKDGQSICEETQFRFLYCIVCKPHLFPSPAFSPLWCRDVVGACSVPHGANSVTGLITDRFFSFHCLKHG